MIHWLWLDSQKYLFLKTNFLICDWSEGVQSVMVPWKISNLINNHYMSFGSWNWRLWKCLFTLIYELLHPSSNGSYVWLHVLFQNQVSQTKQKKHVVKVIPGKGLKDWSPVQRLCTFSSFNAGRRLENSSRRWAQVNARHEGNNTRLNHGAERDDRKRRRREGWR